jgi:isocitrate/isopropylmalate dehydrogenase
VPVGNDPKAVAVATGVNTRDACTRITRFAFEYALKHGRKKMGLSGSAKGDVVPFGARSRGVALPT